MPLNGGVRWRGMALFLLVWPGTACDSASAGSDDCGASLCGCWEDATLSFSATVVDDSGTPLADIDLVCFGESTPIASSAADGILSFEIDTRLSPGCHYERCTNLRITDPAGGYEDVETTAFAADGEAIELTPTAGGG